MCVLSYLYGASSSDFCVRMKLPATNSPSPQEEEEEDADAARQRNNNNNGWSCVAAMTMVLGKGLVAHLPVKSLHFPAFTKFDIL